jgi:hypothetical protein
LYILIPLLLSCAVSPPAGPTETPPPIEPAEHRAEAVVCSDDRPLFDADPYSENAGASCTSHEDCTDGIAGRCAKVFGAYYNYFELECNYHQCIEDADCPAATVCRCRDENVEESINSCLRAGNCLVDADCGEDYCSVSPGECGPTAKFSEIGYFCHTRDDECRSDSDCQELGQSGYCRFSFEDEFWICDNNQCESP